MSSSVTITGTALALLLGHFLAHPLGEDIFRLCERRLDLVVIEDQFGGFLAMLIPHTRVTPGLAHHLDHLCAQFLILVVGVAYCDMERCVLVHASEGVA